MDLRAPVLAGLAAGSVAPAGLQSQQRAETWDIAAAVLPLPDSMRAGARVLIFRGPDLVEVRPGTNEMVCLGDDPAHNGFQASCYHKSLEPFMAKGRELKGRIKSVENTRKITRTMEMVATSKLKRAQDRVGTGAEAASASNA